MLLSVELYHYIITGNWAVLYNIKLLQMLLVEIIEKKKLHLEQIRMRKVHFAGRDSGSPYITGFIDKDIRECQLTKIILDPQTEMS